MSGYLWSDKSKLKEVVVVLKDIPCSKIWKSNLYAQNMAM